jgi:hypothetical protein
LWTLIAGSTGSECRGLALLFTPLLASQLALMLGLLFLLLHEG